jgi:hypothetical protein
MPSNDTGKEIECLCIEESNMIVQYADILLPVIVVVPENGDQERCGKKKQRRAHFFSRWLSSREIGLR